ncbi:MAG: TIGR04002 family protein [Clostridia bacterium]
MKKFKPYIMAAMFAAIIFIFTFTTNLRLPLPNGGYLHFGDSMIYLSALLIPTPFAIVAAAIGAGLADLLSGAVIWMPFTLIIKALMAFAFIGCFNSSKLLTVTTTIRAVIASGINIVLYYFAEAIIMSNIAAPLATLSFNLIQSGGSFVIFVLIALALDKVKFKDTLKRIS